MTALRASVAEIVVARSPLHAARVMARDGATRQRDEARALHRLALGAGDEIAVIEAPDYRTRAAQEARDAARGAGRIPVLEAEYTALAAAAARAREILDGLGRGVAEQRIEWVGADGCPCTGTPDWHGDDLVVDIKVVDATARAVRRGLLEGWATQLAAYREATGATRSAILAVEIDPPCAALFALSESMQEYGARRWERACRAWAACLRDGIWRGPGGCVIDAPAWAMEDE